VQIVRPDRTPWVTLRCADFPILAIWANPAGPFLCLEPWIGRCDDEGFDGDISEKACEAQLAPGECARIGYSIEFHR
jgi:galactose mutarotase-like enzyme